MNPFVERVFATELTHRVLPWSLARRAVVTAADRAWARDAQLREDATWQMRYLVGATERAGEVEDLAHDYVREVNLRLESLWRPWQTTRTPPRFMGRLEKLSRTRRPAIVSFVHHGNFVGHLSSLCRHGVPLNIPAWSGIVDPGSDPDDSSYMRNLKGRTQLTVNRYGGTLFDAVGSREFVREHLRAGETVAIAADIAGNNEVSMLGRKTRVAGGTARLAFETGALVVPMTVSHDGRQQVATCEVELDPRDFSDPTALLHHMMRVFERSVLTWPQGFERPLRRWELSSDDLAEFGAVRDSTLRI